MMKTVICAFCSGIGKDPYDLLSPLSTCQVCNGSGEVGVMEPIQKCVYCSGSGKNPLGARISCIVCGGKGHNHGDQKTKCLQCKGTGRFSDGLPCTMCHGTGFDWTWKIQETISGIACLKGRMRWKSLLFWSITFHWPRNESQGKLRKPEPSGKKRLKNCLITHSSDNF